MAVSKAYADAGVDPSKISPFKQAMREVGQRTLGFPRERKVNVTSMAHGGGYRYWGDQKHYCISTLEGAGNKPYITEWMLLNTGTLFFQALARDAVLMAVNDNIAHGARPFMYLCEVAAPDSDWFTNEKRTRDLATGYLTICRELNMALPQGESPAMKYLLKTAPPVENAPSLSGCVTGIVVPDTDLILGENLADGDHIIGVASSGLHANGISLVIDEAMKLPDKFLTTLPGGTTLGAEALIPTMSYVVLVEALLDGQAKIHKFLPATGGGVSKLASDERNFTYQIHSWLPIPPLFLYFREVLGVSLKDCLYTFNYGVGYFIFVAAAEVDKVLSIGKSAGYDLLDIGVVKEGKRQVLFEPGNFTLYPES